jgi:trigger factor
MKTEIKADGNCTRKITITVPVEEVDEQYQKMLTKLSAKIVIDGFRPGKAPKGLIQKRYGDAIVADLTEELINKGYSQAQKENDLTPLIQPEIEGEINLVPGSEFKAVLSVDVKPEIELREYKGFPLTRKIKPVEDEEIDNTLERIRYENGRIEPVEDRPSKVGDLLLVDFLPEGESKPSRRVLKIDEIATVTLIDHKIGDEIDGHFEFPPDWPDKELAGKIFDAKVTIIELKEMIPAEIDDEFLAQFGEDVTDEQKLNEKIREGLTDAHKSESDKEIRNRAKEEIALRNPIELSEKVIEHAIDGAIQRYWEPDKLEMNQIDEIRKNLRPSTIKNMTIDFVTDKIVEVEKIKVNSDEIKDYVAEIAMKNGLQPDALYRHWRKEGKIDSIREEMLSEKAIDFVVENAVITEE